MKDIKEDWNTMAAAYEEFGTAEDSYSYNIEWRCIRKLLPELKGKSVLDIGCGTGIFTFLLEAFEPERLAGIDLSEKMLAIAKKKADSQRSKAEFICGDAADIREKIDVQFDFIFSSTTTHYIKNLKAMFAGIADCLKEDGRLKNLWGS